MASSEVVRAMYWISVVIVISAMFTAIVYILAPKLIHFQSLPTSGDIFPGSADEVEGWISDHACTIWESRDDLKCDNLEYCKVDTLIPLPPNVYAMYDAHDITYTTIDTYFTKSKLFNEIQDKCSPELHITPKNFDRFEKEKAYKATYVLLRASNSVPTNYYVLDATVKLSKDQPALLLRFEKQ